MSARTNKIAVIVERMDRIERAGKRVPNEAVNSLNVLTGYSDATFDKLAAYAAWVAVHPAATMEECNAFLRAYDAEMG